MVVGGCSEDSRQSQDYAGIPEIDAIFAEFDKPGSPGCGLAVARDGNIIYSRGYGYAMGCLDSAIAWRFLPLDGVRFCIFCEP